MLTGVPHLEKPTLPVGNAGDPDKKYLYYPLHVEGVTLKNLLSPTCKTANFGTLSREQSHSSDVNE